MSRVTPARIVERVDPSGRVTVELRCSCGRTSMTLGPDRAATTTRLISRHRQSSPACRHLAALEAHR